VRQTFGMPRRADLNVEFVGSAQLLASCSPVTPQKLDTRPLLGDLRLQHTPSGLVHERMRPGQTRVYLIGGIDAHVRPQRASADDLAHGFLEARALVMRTCDRLRCRRTSIFGVTETDLGSRKVREHHGLALQPDTLSAHTRKCFLEDVASRAPIAVEQACESEYSLHVDSPEVPPDVACTLDGLNRVTLRGCSVAALR
jgi:hypothetical protein